MVVTGQRYSLPLVVGQRDPLRGHFEVDDGRLGRLSSSSDRVRYGFGHRLRTGQTLHVCRVDVQHIAGCNRTVVIWSVWTKTVVIWSVWTKTVVIWSVWTKTVVIWSVRTKTVVIWSVWTNRQWSSGQCGLRQWSSGQCGLRQWSSGQCGLRQWSSGQCGLTDSGHLVSVD